MLLGIYLFTYLANVEKHSVCKLGHRSVTHTEQHKVLLSFQGSTAMDVMCSYCIIHRLLSVTKATGKTNRNIDANECVD